MRLDSINKIFDIYGKEILQNGLELAYAIGQTVYLLKTNNFEYESAIIDTKGIKRKRSQLNAIRDQEFVEVEQETDYIRPEGKIGIPAFVDFSQNIEKKQLGSGLNSNITCFIPILFLIKNNIKINQSTDNILYKDIKYRIKSISEEQRILNYVGFYNLILEQIII